MKPKLFVESTRLIPLALAAIGTAMSTSAAEFQLFEEEYRQCELRMVALADGVPRFELPGVRYTAWAKRYFAGDAWENLNNSALFCAQQLMAGDSDSVPGRCRHNNDDTSGGIRVGSGVFGLTNTRVKSLLKDALCRKVRRPDTASPTDARPVRNLSVAITPAGRSHACRTQFVVGPERDLTIHCRSTGRDTAAVWHHNLPSPLQQNDGVDSFIGEWKVSAPKAGVKTVSGEYPPKHPLAMTVDVANFSGKRRWPHESGSLSIKMEGKFPTVDVTAVQLPAVPDLGTATLRFSILTQEPGTYFYFGCLSGLKTPAGWPMGEVCGPRTKIQVAFPAPKLGAPKVGNQAPPVPGSGQPLPGVGLPLPQADVPAPGFVAPTIVKQPPALTTVPTLAPQGIMPGALAPQAASPAANDCTGGRSPNPQGRCVCPAGTDWDPNANHCATPRQASCTGGRSPNPQGRCVCPNGTEWNSGANQCARPRQASAPSGQLECRGGEVKGILCWCGIGRFPKPLGGNVYQCQ